MKMFARIAVLVTLSASLLWGQHPPNCDVDCGGTPPVAGSGGSPKLTSTSITNARG
jgi:hypothetical protein